MLTVRIRKISERSNRTYGSRRIHAELKADGISCGRNRIARLMREDGLRSLIKRRFRVTTNSAHGKPVADNILARKFNVHEVAGINRAWVGDITYIATHEGFLYLAVVLDLRSRRVVGWAMRHTLDAELAIAAMISAIADRRPPAGLIFHCDRGKQYVAEPFQAVLRRHGIILSMSRKANCWDNAVAESFFGSIKRELLTRGVWKTREAARSAIFNYIEAWYNTRRRHSTLGYESPASFEARKATRAA